MPLALTTHSVPFVCEYPVLFVGMVRFVWMAGRTKTVYELAPIHHVFLPALRLDMDGAPGRLAARRAVLEARHARQAAQAARQLARRQAAEHAAEHAAMTAAVLGGVSAVAVGLQWGMGPHEVQQRVQQVCRYRNPDLYTALCRGRAVPLLTELRQYALGFVE